MLKRELQQSFAQAKIQLFDRSPDLFPPGCVTYDRYIWAYSISNALETRKNPIAMILNYLEPRAFWIALRTHHKNLCTSQD
jgi:hypothetical protein